MGDDPARALFPHATVRTVMAEGQRWYSVVDCVAALVDTSNPRRYWCDMKARLEREIVVYAISVHVVEMPDTTGRMQATDALSLADLLFIITLLPWGEHANAAKWQIALWAAKAGK